LTAQNKLAISALASGAAVVSSAIDQALQSKLGTAEALLDDYLSARLLALEEKVSLPLLSLSSQPASQIQLVSAIEKGLDVERERIELDRRDIQIQRAQLTFYPPR
jgi:hypothetical protein